MLSTYLYKKHMKKYVTVVKEIDKLSYRNLSKKQLITKFIQSVKNAISNSDLVNAYAVIKEVFERTIDVKLYDEQLIGAMAMFDDLFVEIDTGEGKTYISTILALIKSINQKVYVITINDNLAERDYLKVKKVFDYLDISVSYNKVSSPDDKKRDIYKSSVVYSSTKELIFDYLKNDSKMPDEQLELSLDYAIIDEVDFVLIDGANSTFSVNQNKSKLICENVSSDNDTVKYQIAKEIYDGLIGGILEYAINGSLDESQYDIDYIFTKQNEKCYLTEKGIEKIEYILKVKRLGDYQDIYNALINTIVANKSFVKNRDYIVSGDKIVLINRNNGRKMVNSQMEYYHQLALELKENVTVSKRSTSSNTISYQVFFNLFKNISGMSGTIAGAEDEFEEIFQHKTFKVPRHFKLNRIDNETKYFKSKDDKYNYLGNILKENQSSRRSILIICESELEMFQVIKYIDGLNLKIFYNVLNSYNDECENEIVNKSGRSGNITITTNMLGRGTDIKIDKELNEVGGLFVISMNRYSNLRIENQIRGRVGRQGARGECIFLSSLEDNLYFHFDLYKINKIKALKEEMFHSEKNQIKIHKIANTCQKYITNTLLIQRKNTYKISYTLYMQKKYLENKINEFTNSESFNLSLGKIVEDELLCLEQQERIFDETILFFGREISDIKEINIYEIKKDIKNKIELMGVDVSKILFKNIYIELINSNFNDYSIGVKKIALSNNLGGKNSNEKFSKFIIQVNEKFKLFEKYLNITTLEYLLKAEIKRKDNT